MLLTKFSNSKLKLCRGKTFHWVSFRLRLVVRWWVLSCTEQWMKFYYRIRGKWFFNRFFFFRCCRRWAKSEHEELIERRLQFATNRSTCTFLRQFQSSILQNRVNRLFLDGRKFLLCVRDCCTFVDSTQHYTDLNLYFRINEKQNQMNGNFKVVKCKEQNQYISISKEEMRDCKYQHQQEILSFTLSWKNPR